MNMYIIRFAHPERGSAHAEVLAQTEADAREDFERRNPECTIISSFVKPKSYGPMGGR